MKSATRALLLCLALHSSLTHAAGETDLGGEAPHGNSAFELAFGLGGALLMIPGGFVSYAIADHMFPPYSECDAGGCWTPGAHWGGLLGMVAGGALSLSLGSGYAVAWAGRLQGGAFNPGAAAFGGFLGGLVGLAASVPVAVGVTVMFGSAGSNSLGYVIPPFIVAGAALGAVLAYGNTRPFLPPPAPDGEDAPEVHVAPMVMLVPGGGMVGLAGTLW